jgi:hypothetical protein
MHVAVDATGRLLRLIITEGQVADISCANELIEHLRAKAVIADKGYEPTPSCSYSGHRGEGRYPAALESQDEAPLQSYLVPHSQSDRTLL